MRIADQLRARREEIPRVAAKHGAGNVCVFGSVARGEETADSDVDLLVDVAGEPTPWFPGGLVADLDSGIGAEGRLSLVRSERAYLEHVLHCIRRIQEDSCGGKEVVFASTSMRHPEVDWRGISGLRNVLVHGYFELDLETIWTIIQRDLPVLDSAVRRLLEEPPTT
jgi:hypothetical protein